MIRLLTADLPRPDDGGEGDDSGEGNRYGISVDGAVLIEYTDENNPFLTGMVGFSNLKASHTHYASFREQGL